MALGSHPIHAAYANAAGEMGHSGGRRILEDGGLAERAHSNQPYANSRHVRDTFTSAFVR
ncbi:hypothetical protein ACHAXA_009287 [Cyclostephanos tholiformis]|uniref:Uncharacterized protein n=1 Tax=Cyclostephanos tholiformis TaxID=382380 RepID=A0ABD3RE38_9STRA